MLILFNNTFLQGLFLYIKNELYNKDILSYWIGAYRYGILSHQSFIVQKQIRSYHN